MFFFRLAQQKAVVFRLGLSLHFVDNRFIEFLVFNFTLFLLAELQIFSFRFVFRTRVHFVQRQLQHELGPSHLLVVVAEVAI